MRSVVRLGMMVGSVMMTTAGLGAFGGPASAGAPVGGCPSGFQLLSVAALAGEGYEAPGLIDTGDLGNPHSNAWNSQPGNGDGYVCGRPEGNRTTFFGGQLYLFVDNQLPASS